MNQMQGRVVLRGSNAGIAELLVAVYEMNLETEVPSSNDNGAPEKDESYGNRLGSVMTSSEGAFAFTYQSEDVRGLNRKERPDLLVVVSTPDEGCNCHPGQRSRLAACVRRDAARIESLVIHIDEARLAEAGIAVPGKERDVEQVIAQRRAAAERPSRLRAESRRLFTEKLESRRKLERQADLKFDTFLSALSAVPAERLNQEGSRYVPRGTSVHAANQAMMKSGIEGRINQAAVVGSAALSDEQAARFQDANGNFLESIAAAAIEPLLRPKRLGRSPSLFREPPLSLLCREHQPVDPCVEILEGTASSGHEHNGQAEPDSEPGPATDGVATLPLDVPILIETLVEHMTPPESATIFTVHGRAGIEEVQEGVNGFALHSGPADAPSLHDFHHLQIAFEYVWQELFDEGVVQTGKELYTDLVELGVDPNEYLGGPLENMVKQFSTSLSSALNAAMGTSDVASSEPDLSVIEVFDISPKQWTALHQDQRTRLIDLANLIEDRADDPFTIVPEPDPPNPFNKNSDHPSYFRPGNEAWLTWKRENIRMLRRQGEGIINYVDHKLEEPESFDQFHQNLRALDRAIKEPYRFSIYAANESERSVNFGVVATYRQKWEPVSYQVGELVKTVPLAPKEIRRFTKKVAVRKSRAEKEVENHLQSRKTESTETARAESEIIQKALNKTNFQVSAEGGGGVGFVHASGKTAFAQDAATESQEVKKEFREAVFKAAEEYKQERTTEINVSTSEEVNLEESGEISNPNDEITVTYLFYELQRRYRVSEQIHRVTPIVLVAQEFPKPSEIDEAWIVANDWILRRVILDDSFIPAMNYLASKVVGDEVSLQEMYRNLKQQRRIVEELKDELIAMRSLAESRYAAFQKSIEKRADAVQEEEDSGGIIPMPVGFITDSSDDSVDAARVREEAAKDAYERAMKQEKEVLGRLERETTALSTLTETYTKNLSDHLNRKAQIARLRVHIKSNIMHYMQAIWNYEPPDQRFFRLHEVLVPKLTGTTTYTLEEDPDAIPMPPDWKKPYKLIAKCKLDANLESETLAEVADLDNLLGFKGNYMMFPLKKSNVLTDFMTLPYLDAVTGIRDPDPLGNWTLSEFLKYVCCLHEKLSKAKFDSLLPGLQAAYQQLVNAPRTDGEEIIVPTDSLFIEALPGVHPILEDFKLFHRVVDVKKAQAGVRAAELENVRAAARLLAGEREDPTIEKKVVIEGGNSVLVPVDDN